MGRKNTGLFDSEDEVLSRCFKRSQTEVGIEHSSASKCGKYLDDDDGVEGEEEEADQTDEEESAEAGVNGDPSPIGTGSCDSSKSVSITLTDTDVLDCPICFEPLNYPVYQCLNGHIACQSCCSRTEKKCGTCSRPIRYRSRALVKVIVSVKISCENKQYGCTEPIHYYMKYLHEKICYYTPCSCPHPRCDYVGLSDCLYTHFSEKHSKSSNQFDFGSFISISFGRGENCVFLQERKESTLFILNRSIETRGSVINVICVAKTSTKRHFLYDLTAKNGGCSIILKAASVAFMPKWNVKPPAKNFLVIPSDFCVFGQLKLELIIRS